MNVVKDLEQRVVDAQGEVLTLRVLKRQYEAAHPALAVYALDYGDQVFIGDPVSSIGLWVTKCKTSL